MLLHDSCHYISLESHGFVFHRLSSKLFPQRTHYTGTACMLAIGLAVGFIIPFTAIFLLNFLYRARLHCTSPILDDFQFCTIQGQLPLVHIPVEIFTAIFLLSSFYRARLRCTSPILDDYQFCTIQGQLPLVHAS